MNANAGGFYLSEVGTPGSMGTAGGSDGGNADNIFGVSYDSSPVDDDDRTFDLPVDEQLKLSAAYAWKGSKLDFAVGATLMWAGDAKVDQTSQLVRAKGEFDENYILFLGGTLHYEF